MEILNIIEVTKFAWWQAISIAIVIFGIIMLIISIYEDGDDSIMILSIISLFIGIMIMVYTPWQRPTGVYTYTVEITESAKYEELINAGYDFERVYDTKQIYNITGDELK